MAASGVILGSILIVGCAFIGYYFTFLLVRAGNIAKQYSYQKLAILAYGKKFELFVKWVFFINNWGGCVIYTILINQLILKALDIFFTSGSLPSIMTNVYFWPPVFTTLCILPVSLFRELSSLRYFCLMGFCFMIYLAFVIVFEAFDPTISNFSSNIRIVKLFDITGITTTLPTAFFAYMCHPNVLDVYRELQRSTKPRMSKVLRREMALVMCIYVTVGLAGYITFANDLSNMGSGGNILNGAYQNHLLVTLAILLIGFSVIIAMPLSIKPSKDSLRDIIYPFDIDDPNSAVNIDSDLRHVVLVFITTYSQMAAGMCFTSIGLVINFLGSSANPLICFVFPCLFYLKLDKSPTWSQKRVICHTLNTLMILFAIYSTVTFMIQNF